MKYIDEFRNPKLAKQLIKLIHKLAAQLDKPISIMEVCGSHTVAMFRYGIRKILPDNIRVIAGPGCPVCVTSQEDIDRAIGICEYPDTIITTFGDMIKVPGTKTTLRDIQAQGRDIRVVYSTLNALDFARENKQKKVIHIAVGFETTIPTVAAAVQRAKQEKLNNFFVLSSHKIIPPALKVLVASPKSEISGFLLPGHVSTIIGSKPYEFLVKKYKIPCVIAGFEALDILQSIVMLLNQQINKQPKVEMQYARCVNAQGNLVAQKMIAQVFKVSDVQWRGLGLMKKSGLILRPEYKAFDALRHFPVKVPKTKKTACRCGDVLQGIINPTQCVLFKKICNPSMPIGPCMVSSEGACSAYYRYGGKRNG
ncbi:MAG: hydrogenase formation protein HypD [Candidatus Omnitrophica bacterium]|nr:hydrogenase formation protein HypD [Candidatus Omnitrophota bacterium]